MRGSVSRSVRYALVAVTAALLVGLLASPGPCDTSYAAGNQVAKPQATVPQPGSSVAPAATSAGPGGPESATWTWPWWPPKPPCPPVPEPSSLVLLGLGFGAAGAWWRKRRQSKV